MSVTPALIDLMLDEHKRRIADAVRRAEVTAALAGRRKPAPRRALPSPRTLSAPVGCT